MSAGLVVGHGGQHPPPLPLEERRPLRLVVVLQPHAGCVTEDDGRSLSRYTKRGGDEGWVGVRLSNPSSNGSARLVHRPNHTGCSATLRQKSTMRNIDDTYFVKPLKRTYNGGDVFLVSATKKTLKCITNNCTVLLRAF